MLSRRKRLSRRDLSERNCKRMSLVEKLGKQDEKLEFGSRWDSGECNEESKTQKREKAGG